MKRQSLSFLLSALISIPAVAQTNFDETTSDILRAGGVYLPYQEPTEVLTPAPKGYEPVYIAHFSRHGSRYLIADRDLQHPIDIMAQARKDGKLTEQGLEVLSVLEDFMVEMDGRGGELTPLGERQHRGIASRMYDNYPGVFAKGARVTSVSTPVMRCAYSMLAFTDGLREKNPSLRISRESSERVRRILNHHSKESDRFKHSDSIKAASANLQRRLVKPCRLMGALFNDSAYVRDNIDAARLMESLYWVAVDLPNTEQKASLSHIFTKQEMFDLWRLFNFHFYSGDASYPRSRGLYLDNADRLLKNMMDSTEHYLSTGTRGATLRFAHDGNIIPLLARMQLDGTYGYSNDPDSVHTVWANWKVAPMAANLQWVLYRNKKNPDDILVKFLLNERETGLPFRTASYPYYKWEDASAFLKKVLATPSVEFMPKDMVPPATN